jgi:tyrosinase
MGLLRKNYNVMSDDQKQRFVNAFEQLNTSRVVSRFADIHDTNFGRGIHGTSHFLPWHREMLYRFEQELQRVDSSLTIPYWDSSVDNKSYSPLWAWDFLGQFDYYYSLERAFGAAPNSYLPTVQQVQDNQGQPTYDVFWPDLQDNIHNPPHQWVGGTMATGNSPWDPAFYLHHCWIDMLWARWQSWHRLTSNFVASPPTWRSWGLTDPLLAWTNPTRTPENVLDHRKLGYRYDTEDYLLPGEELYPGQWIYSASRTYILWCWADRCGVSFNLVGGQQPLQPWAAPTNPLRQPGPACRLMLKYDGNLILYDPDKGPNNPTWQMVPGRINVGNLDRVRILDSGHLALYDTNNDPIWTRPPPQEG